MEKVEKGSADMLLEFLKLGGKSAVENIEILKEKIDALEAANAEAKLLHDSVSTKLSQIRQLEVENKAAAADLEDQRRNFRIGREYFEAEKFEAKKDRELAVSALSAANAKAAEIDLKLKRLASEEERIKGLEFQNLALKQKLVQAQKQIEKIIAEI